MRHIIKVIVFFIEGLAEGMHKEVKFIFVTNICEVPTMWHILL